MGPENRHLLIGETPLIGNRLIELAQRREDGVIDSDWRNHALKIRVLNGPSIGLEGWVYYELCPDAK